MGSESSSSRDNYYNSGDSGRERERERERENEARESERQKAKETESYWEKRSEQNKELGGSGWGNNFY